MSALDELPTVTLPDGTELECLDALEAGYLVRDVERYFERDLGVAPGAVVLDVGANVGLFTAALTRRLAGAVEVLAFEPVPPIFAVLARNLARLPGALRPLSIGIGARAERLSFTSFPRLGCLSSSCRGEADLEAERTRVGAALLSLMKAGEVMPHLAALPDPLLEGLVDSFLRSRMVPEHHEVEVRPLSEVIAERALARIDLLKVDVEGAEEAVLDGIAAEHWPRVRSLVLELERFRERIEPVSRRLESLGFTVETGQSASERSGDHGLVHAHRGHQGS
jgi:FkbM family methyltransferase